MNAMYVGGEEKHLNNFATLKGTWSINLPNSQSMLFQNLDSWILNSN